MIDYENVHGDGLAGCQNLGKNDHIVIFFTQNAKNIDMSDISNHGSAALDMIEVPAGKQSADMHIGSYLGYLAGKGEKNCNVVIVSKDTDFDKVIKFWKQKVGIVASRTEQIKKKTTKSQPSKKQATSNIAKTGATTASSKTKTAANTEVQKILSKAGFSNDITNYVASIVVKNLGQKNGKQQIYRTIIAKYGQGKGLVVYQHIKKHI